MMTVIWQTSFDDNIAQHNLQRKKFLHNFLVHAYRICAPVENNLIKILLCDYTRDRNIFNA